MTCIAQYTTPQVTNLLHILPQVAAMLKLAVEGLKRSIKCKTAPFVPLITTRYINVLLRAGLHTCPLLGSLPIGINFFKTKVAT